MGDLKYTAPPTCAQFMRSEAFGRLILGPIGSGKTTSCIIELLRRAVEQKPGSDGMRYTRFAIVRQTLQQLKSTVLKDIETWLSGLGTWRVSESTFHLNFNNVRSEWNFIPLETSEDQGRLLSMQLTGAMLSEFTEMNLDIVAPVTGRLGRYPSGARGNPTWHGLIGDSNMPVEMSPWHTFLENLPGDWQKFKQPSGLSSEAENLNWLLQTDETKSLLLDDPKRTARGRLYYERYIQMYGEDSDWVNRYVKAEYGNDPSGAAVFKESFRYDFHTVPETLLIPGYPILVGQDFGRNPWSLIGQMDHMGRLLIHEEVPAKNIGLEKHINEHLKPVLYKKYLGYKVVLIGDPSGISKSSISEESNFDALSRLGLPNYPAPTNDIDPRIRAVEELLGRQTGGGPSLIISRRGCPHLIRALGGGYRYKKTKDGALKPKPDKDDPEGFSHVADDLEYLALIIVGNVVDYIARRLFRKPKEKKQRVSAAGWT